MIDLIKTNLRNIGVWVLILGFAGWLFSIQSTANAGNEQSDINAKTLFEVAKTQAAIGGQFQLLKELGAINLDTFRKYRALPNEPTGTDGNVQRFKIIGDDALYVIDFPDSCKPSVLRIPYER